MGERIKIDAKKPLSIKENFASNKRKTIFRSLTSHVDQILFFQRTIGNLAVQRFIKSGILQTKLGICQPGDKYEQEANRVAEAVMQIPEPAAASCSAPHIQRACPTCDEDELRQQPIKGEEEELQAKTTSDSIPEVQPDIESHIHSLKGGGQPLSKKDRPFFEPRFVRDFSQIRVHADTKAAGVPAKTEESRNNTGMSDHLKSGLENLSGMNLSSIHVHLNSSKPAQLNALAYTQGHDIHISPGQEKHLPHEGWHAVQQMQGRVKPTMHTKGVSINDDAGMEKEADVMGTKALQMMRTEQATSSSQRFPAIQLHSQIFSLKSKDLCKTKFDKSTYVEALVKKGDGSMTDVVDRLISAKTIKVNGRRNEYANKMLKYNYKPSAHMHVGDCLLMLKKWKDPNIGILPSHKSIRPGMRARIIATIYGEQTQNFPQQHRYIWYAIKKRIESWERPAKLVYPGKKKGVLSQFDAFGEKQYMDAKEYLISGKTTLLTNEFNPKVVDNIEKMVKSEWSKKIPKDAGMFYFHWTKYPKVSQFLNNCWKKKKYAKKNDKDREIACVKDFRQHLGWDAKLVKSIPPSGAHKKGSPPFGTMYIFKSERQP